MNEKKINDFEGFIEQRKSTPPEGNAVPWLITFADLMTILLVFCFVLFTVYNRPGTVKKVESQSGSSLMSIAYAVTSNAVEPAPPTFIPQDVHRQKDAPRTVRIIKSSIIDFSPGSKALNKYSKASLGMLVDLAEKNPDTKFVLTACTKDLGTRQLQNAQSIVDYLAVTCGIERSRIYVQNIPSGSESDDGHGNPLDSTQVAVKLTKAFWWF